MTIICDANLEGALRQAAHVNLAVKDIREAFGREPRSALYRINAGMRFALSFLQLNHQKTIFPELVPYWQSVKSMIEIRSLIGNKHYPSTRSLGDLNPPEATLLLRFMEVEDAAKKILLPEKANPDGSYTITVPKGDYVLSKAGDTITLPKKLAEVRAEMRAAYDDLYAGYVAAMKVKLGFDPAATPADMRAADREDAAKVIEMLQELYHPGYVSHTRQGRYGLKYTKDGREMFEAIQGSGVTIAAQERDSLRRMEALRARLLTDPTATKVGKIFDVRNLDDIYKNLPDTGYLENISMVLQALVAPARGEARETVENLIKKLTELAEKRKTGKLQARRDVGGWLTPENASTYLKSTYPSYLFTMSNAIARVATERQRSAAIADIPARDVRKLAEDHNEYLYSDESQEAAIRALAFYYTLGGNISSSVMQLTQTPQVGIPFFAPHAGVGRTVATMARASTEVLQAFKLALRADKVFTPERLKVPAEEKEMIQRMMDRGILQPMVTQDEAPALMERHSSEAINALGRKFGKLLEVMGLGFRATEQASRMITAITAYRLTANPEVLASIKRVAASVGDVVNTRDDAVKFAVEKVNFFQGPELRAKAFRGYASIPFQFQSFPVNMLMNWVEAAMYYGGRGVFKSPEGRQMLSLLVMGIFMTSGVWGLPFASSLADLLDFLSEQVAKTPLGAAMGLSPTATKAQLQRTLAEIFKEVPLLAQEGDAHELASLFFNGPFRLSGADISKRAGLEIIQGNPLQMDIFSFGPFGGAVLGGAKDASNYMSKDMPLMALASLFPIAVRNFARAYEMRESGYVTPGKIEPALPASELQGIPEAISVALGFTPAKIAEAREAKMEAKELGQRMDAVRKAYSDSIATNLAKAAQAKNPADARSYEERAQRLFEEIARRDEGKEPDARILVDTQAFNTSIRNKITQYLVPESGKGVPKVTRGEYLERVQGG